MKDKNLISRTRNIHPMIYEKTRDGEMLYDVFSRLVKERIIFLSDDIDADSGTIIAATLLFLDNQNSNKEISLYINSVGGSVCDGLFTIYDTMHYIKSPIKTVCIGEAYSAAAVLLASGTPGKRMAFENANVMIHEIQVGDMCGTGTQIKKEANRIEKINNRMLEIIAKHTKQPLSKIKEDCKEDKYLTAQEALEYGIIDSIVKPKKILPNISDKSNNKVLQKSRKTQVVETNNKKKTRSKKK